MKLLINTIPYKTCFYIDGNLNCKDTLLVKKILSDSKREFIPDEIFFKNHIEIGPRKNFKTAWNSNVCQILKDVV